MVKRIIENGSLFFRAYMLLIFVDFGLRFFGFPKIVKICLKEVKLAENSTASLDWDKISKTVRIAQKAFLFYLKPQTKCLERSLVICSLLRRLGIPAQFCIGCPKYPPFNFHAWVECEGRIVNDFDSIKDTYIQVAVK